VDGAFHTPLQAPTAEALLPTLAATAFAAPSWPVVTNHDAEAVTDGAGWPERLTDHLVTPVRWAESVDRLVALGAQRFVEVGPGRTLTGLIRRIAPEVAVA
jgi:[acyl-carrier-protein] S-malonyltransferase